MKLENMLIKHNNNKKGGSRKPHRSSKIPIGEQRQSESGHRRRLHTTSSSLATRPRESGRHSARERLARQNPLAGASHRCQEERRQSGRSSPQQRPEYGPFARGLYIFPHFFIPLSP